MSGAFDQVVETTIDELKDEGFGVLCDIDVQATLEEKLGEEFQQYRILGTCNPGLAYEGLTRRSGVDGKGLYHVDDRHLRLRDTQRVSINYPHHSKTCSIA